MSPEQVKEPRAPTKAETYATGTDLISGPRSIVTPPSLYLFDNERRRLSIMSS